MRLFYTYLLCVCVCFSICVVARQLYVSPGLKSWRLSHRKRGFNNGFCGRELLISRNNNFSSPAPAAPRLKPEILYHCAPRITFVVTTLERSGQNYTPDQTKPFGIINSSTLLCRGFINRIPFSSGCLLKNVYSHLFTFSTNSIETKEANEEIKSSIRVSIDEKFYLYEKTPIELVSS